MKREISSSLISFAYTLLYVLVLDVNIVIFDFLILFSETGFASSSHMDLISNLLYAILTIGVILLVAFQFSRIRGYFAWIYISSLLASFLMPLFFGSLNSGGWISFPWYFTGVLTLGMNLVLGPSMIFLLSYFVKKAVVKYSEKKNEISS